MWVATSGPFGCGDIAEPVVVGGFEEEGQRSICEVKAFKCDDWLKDSFMLLCAEMRGDGVLMFLSMEQQLQAFECLFVPPVSSKATLVPLNQITYFLPSLYKKVSKQRFIMGHGKGWHTVERGDIKETDYALTVNLYGGEFQHRNGRPSSLASRSSNWRSATVTRSSERATVALGWSPLCLLLPSQPPDLPVVGVVWLRRGFQKLHNKGRIFFQYFSHDTQKHGYALFPDETLSSDAYHDIDYVQGQVLAEIEGPVNGLFCLSNCEDRFIIWNPAIREFRTLPYPYHPNLPPHPEVYGYSIGFGVDPLTGEFKLVLIRRVENFKRRALDAYVTVFTLCTNTWRHLDGLDHLMGDRSLTPSTTGKHVDGVYYWWTGYAILTFDMGMEVFRVIPAPFILPSELLFFLRCDSIRQ
ncbi:hypothetical protein RHMOL_Rhmol08G0258600 [Rhododendron molle]|uniref:Uncharacterized protein n=1 Tax=Rhododendron molle TaxID=49168 RepID=A0ACC0MUL6_RHOML|nr:hypothetical protein RHMOL_Rhmol08G0258600 [Rhododendron molle]